MNMETGQIITAQELEIFLRSLNGSDTVSGFTSDNQEDCLEAALINTPQRHQIRTDQDSSYREDLLTDIIKRAASLISAGKADNMTAMSQYFAQAVSSCGLGTISYRFYETIIGSADWTQKNTLSKRINAFRCLCAYFFGSFEVGFKNLHNCQLGHRPDIKTLWEAIYPTDEVVEKRKQRYAKRQEPTGVQIIPGEALWELGYLAKDQANKIHINRQMLLTVLLKAEDKLSPIFQREQFLLSHKSDNTERQHYKIEEDAYEILKMACIEAKFAETFFPTLQGRAAMPETAWLLPQHIEAGSRSYYQRYEKAKEICSRETTPVNISQSIKELQHTGRQNTFSYVTFPDLDIYVATSMRDPHHFTTTSRLIQSLRLSSELDGLKLQIFDPTQSYSHDRIDKGLIECLMIHKSKLTLYNAQEADTFGKDSEAAVSLAEGHPVVIYVTRLFDNSGSDGIKRAYEAIDLGRGRRKNGEDGFLMELRKHKILSKDEAEKLKPSAISKTDIVGLLLEKYARRTVFTMPIHDISAGLETHGYPIPEPSDGETEESAAFLKNVHDYAYGIMERLERRAATFLEGHPLALQVSVKDGVARGVIVTRSIDVTARVVRGILLGNLSLELRPTAYSWHLLEKLTQSPIRVVTNDPYLRATLQEAYATNDRDRGQHTPTFPWEFI